MPTVDYSKYDVLNINSFQTIPTNSGPFHHGTKFEIAWKDTDTCGDDYTMYLCQNGSWIGELPECQLGTFKRGCIKSCLLRSLKYYHEMHCVRNLLLSIYEMSI